MKDSSEETEAAAEPIQEAEISRPHDAKRARGAIETNVTKSGHLHYDNIPGPAKTKDQHDSSRPDNQQEKAMADDSKVPIASVRLDTAYPRVAGISAAPLRSPFCSDDSAPATPRVRAALPGAAQTGQAGAAQDLQNERMATPKQQAAPQKAAQAAQGARSIPASQTDGEVAREVSPQPADQAAASRSPSKEPERHADLSSPLQPSGASTGTPSSAASSPPPNVTQQTKAAGLQDQSRASQSAEGHKAPVESPPPAPAAPQMPAWLLAELRSPSKMSLLVSGPTAADLAALRLTYTSQALQAMSCKAT